MKMLVMLRTRIVVYMENISKVVLFVLSGPSVALILVEIVLILDGIEERDQDPDRLEEIKNWMMTVKLIVVVALALLADLYPPFVQHLQYDHLKCPIMKVPFRFRLKLGDLQFLNK